MGLPCIWQNATAGDASSAASVIDGHVSSYHAQTRGNVCIIANKLLKIEIIRKIILTAQFKKCLIYIFTNLIFDQGFGLNANQKISDVINRITLLVCFDTNQT